MDREEGDINDAPAARAMINNLVASRYDIIRQVEKQCIVNEQFASIESKLHHGTKVIRAELDEIDRYISISKERHGDGLFTTHHPSKDAEKKQADREVDEELNVTHSKRTALATRQTQCPSCGMKMLKSFTACHALVCSVLNGPDQVRIEDSNVEYTLMMEKISVRPHPPRNLKITEVSFSSMTLAWELGIIDGGEPIIEYEVVYHSISIDKSAPTTRIKQRGKRQRVAMLCSRWCLMNPIPYKDFVIDGLDADASYVDIKLRCRNKVGWSDFCQKIESVKTAVPIPPLHPQHFEVSNISSNSVSFEIYPPFHMGGGKLQGYELTYLEPIINELQEAGVKNKEIRLEKRVVNVSQDKTSITLKNLRGETLYSDFQLIAINSFGLRSNPLKWKSVQTMPPSRLHALQKEIEWAKSTRRTWVDSDFFQPGIMQREDKKFYLAKLEAEFAKLEGESNLENEGFNNDSNNENDMDTNSGSPSIREKKFVFRINALASELIEHKETILSNTTARSLRIRKMTSSQKRLVELQVEKKRLAEVSDEFTSSTTLNGTVQKFGTADLRSAIDSELESTLAMIETWKSEIIGLDNTSNQLMDMIDMKEARLQDRKATYSIFKKQKDCSSKLRMKSSQLPQDMLQHHFSSWASFVKGLKVIRKSHITLQRMINISLMGQMINKWKNFAALQSKDFHLKKKNISIESRAGSLLIEVEMGRDNMHASIMTQMQSDHNKHIENENYFDLSLSKNAGTLPDEYLKAEFYANLLEFDKALNWYKKAFRTICTRDECNVQSNEMQCVLESKIGRILLIMNSPNEALLYFDNVLNQAINMRVEEFIAITSFNIAECYRLMGEFIDAKHHYLNCTSLKSQIPKVQKIQNVASEGLMLCKGSMVSTPQKIFQPAVTSEIEKNIKSGIKEANDLESKISFISTQRGYSIDLEYASAKCILLRRKKTLLIQKIATNNEELILTRKELKRLPPLISSLEREIHQPGKATKASSLVHDSVQIFEDGELQARLQERLKESNTAYNEVTKKDDSLSVETRNLEDIVRDIEEDLNLEISPLMLKILSKRRIRLMAFNSIQNSKDSDDDEGTDNLLGITFDKDIYIYDLISGQSLQVLQSEESNRSIVGHSKTITAIFFRGNLVFTGSLDCSLCCWNIKANKLQYTNREGHESTITSICATPSLLVSGSADKTLICWKKDTGLKLHRLYHHSSGILSLCEGTSSTLLSGDAAGEICIWDITTTFKCIQRLRIKPRHRVTVLKSGKLEVVSGDSGGFITIFWIESGKIIQQCKAHESSITDLQFDATRVVSSAMDQSIKIIDITTCQVLHSIVKGHDGPILACIFDSVKITSLSTDYTVKHWLWKDPDDGICHSKGEKLHTVVEGDDMRKIAKIHGVSLSNLIKWNNQENLQDISIGQKLIIRKNDISQTKSFGIDSDENEWQSHQQVKFCNDQRIGETCPDTSILEISQIKQNILCEPSTLARRLR